MKYTVEAKHAESIGPGGRSVAPGDEVELTPEEEADPGNQRMVREGILIPTTPSEGVGA